MFNGWIGNLAITTRRAGRKSLALLERELAVLAQEIALTRTLVPLLARQRQGEWSALEKAELRAHLWRVSRVSTGLALLMLPGSFVALPLIVLWRERRRTRAVDTRNIDAVNRADA